MLLLRLSKLDTREYKKQGKDYDSDVKNDREDESIYKRRYESIVCARYDAEEENDLRK